MPGKITSEFVTHQCDDYEDTLPVSVELYFCGGLEVADMIDAAIGKANCIRNELIKREQYPLDDTHVWTNVTDIEPKPMPTNDDVVIIEMSLVLLLRYCTDNCA